MIPVQLIGMAGAVVFAILMGLREKRRIAAASLKGTTPYEMDSLLPVSDDTADISDTVQKPKKPLINGGLIIASVICLAFGFISALCFYDRTFHCFNG
ncbi:hypothetical protein ACLFLC_14115 [Providencia rettgeri]